MDPLVEEYKKVGVGNIKTEVNLKAYELTKRFAIKLGLGALVLELLSLTI